MTTPAPSFEMRGINVPTYGFRGEADFKAAMTDVVKMGVNTVIIDFHLHVDSLTSNEVTFLSKGNDDFANTQKMVKIASDLGLKVIAKPTTIVGVDDHNWQQMAPTDSVKWFQSYTAAWDTIIKALNPLGLDSILLSNELRSMTTNPAYRGEWVKMIDHIRETFKGEVGTNAGAFVDVGTNEFENVTFLDKLDFLGMSAYPRLYNTATPTEKDVVDGWFKTADSATNVIQTIRDFLEAHPGLKLAMTEFGSYPVDGGMSGWVANQQSTAMDFAEQAMVFDQSIGVLSSQLGDQLVGLFPYRINGNTIQDSTNPAFKAPAGGDWGLDGKPAEKVVADWYSGNKVAPGVTVSGSIGADVIGSGFYNDTLIGGTGNDKLMGGQGDDTLIGNTLTPLAKTTVPLTFSLSGSILNGVAPNAEVWVNGTKIGSIDMPEVMSYTTNAGAVSWSKASFTFDVPAGVTVTDLHLVQPNSESQGANAFRHLYINTVQLDGVDLAPTGKLYSVNGGTNFSSVRSLGSKGNFVLDATPYNTSVAATIAESLTDNDVLDGGAGIDTVAYAGNKSQYLISGGKVTDISGKDGVDTLINIELIKFADVTVHINVEGNEYTPPPVVEAPVITVPVVEAPVVLSSVIVASIGAAILIAPVVTPIVTSSYDYVTESGVYYDQDVSLVGIPPVAETTWWVDVF